MKSQNIMAFILVGLLMIVGYGIIRYEIYEPTVHLIAKTPIATDAIRKQASKPMTIVKAVKAVKVEKAALDCMTANLFFEARNQSVKGMEAVGLVVLNRMRTKHYPKSVCKVVYQRKQFSWTAHNPKPNLKNILERRQWKLAEQTAKSILSGTVADFTKGATHYHATYVSPPWAKSKRMTWTTQIETHIFYRDTKLKLDRDA